jgi:arginyl-tRNA synthetase
MDIKVQISDVIKKALNKLEVEFDRDIVIEHPKNKEHGDYSTNVAMQLTKVLRKNPREIAGSIIDAMDLDGTSISKVDIAGPGFINFFVDSSFLFDVLNTIIKMDDTYGESEAGTGESVLVEYVSANPTGDLHIGHARGASYGDSLTRIYKKAGYKVWREFYINDAGNQIHNLVLSAEARYKQALGLDATMPEDGYFGEDIIQLGKELAEEFGNQYADVIDYALFREKALAFEKAKLSKDLSDFGVEFDQWYSEQSLYDDGVVEETIAKLKELGHTYEKDGATWLKTSEHGDEKDRVIVKSDGTLTYMTPDVGYHANKLSRGYNLLIDVLGADHHGYLSRMRASIEMLGYQKEQLEFEILQMVRVLQNGEEVKMSKRSGKAISIRDLVDEVGTDPIRYFFAMRSLNTHMDLDLDLALRETNENPVYYAQYAHARVSSILKQAESKGLTFTETFDTITSGKALELLNELSKFPNVVADAAAKRLPHLVTNYINDLASLFHSYYASEKFLTEDKDYSEQRVTLVKAVQITLRNALDLVGVSAPEEM